MQQLSIIIEDWQKDALEELAGARGVRMEEMAKSLLSEQIVEHIHCAFDDLFAGAAILPNRTLPSPDTIENRLRHLSDD